MATKSHCAAFILISWHGASRPRVNLHLTLSHMSQTLVHSSLAPRDRLRPWWLSRELGVQVTVLFITDHGSTMNSIVLSYIFVLIASVHINIILELRDSFVNMNQYHLYT